VISFFNCLSSRSLPNRRKQRPSQMTKSSFPYRRRPPARRLPMISPIPLGEFRLLAKYYYDECEDKWMRSASTRRGRFLIVPLLLALGWAEQQLKSNSRQRGRGRVDTVCFSRPFHRKRQGVRRLNRGQGIFVRPLYAWTKQKATPRFPLVHGTCRSNGLLLQGRIPPRRTEAGILARAFSVP